MLKGEGRHSRCIYCSADMRSLQGLTHTLRPCKKAEHKSETQSSHLPGGHMAPRAHTLA